MSLACKQHTKFRAIFLPIAAAVNQILFLTVLLGKWKLHSLGVYLHINLHLVLIHSFIFLMVGNTGITY